MEHTFFIDNCVLVLERKKIKFKKKTQKISYQPNKIVRIFSGTSQGSVLSATLFRLHIHSLPKVFARFCSHLFADDVAVVIKGQIEKDFQTTLMI